MSNDERPTTEPLDEHQAFARLDEHGPKEYRNPPVRWLEVHADSGARVELRLQWWNGVRWIDVPSEHQHPPVPTEERGP